MERDETVEIQLTDWVQVTLREVEGELLLTAVAALALLLRRWRQVGELRHQVERGSAVNQLLGRLLELSKADRVVVYKVVLGEGALWRCCLLGEAARPGMAPMPDREIPVERLWAEFEALQDGKLHRYYAHTRGRCADYLRRLGVQEQWSRLLYWHGLPLALVGIQYRTRGRREVPKALEPLLVELGEALCGRKRLAAKN